MTLPNESYSSDDAKHEAAVQASGIIEQLDDELVALHTAAVEALVALGLHFGAKGLPPYVVLGQMNQAVAVAFASHIMPRYRLEQP